MRQPARTIEMERHLAELRCDLAAVPDATHRERTIIALGAQKRLRAREMNEAYRIERPGYTTYDYAAWDARYDVRVMVRYRDLLAALLRAENRAQGFGAVTGAPCSPSTAIVAGFAPSL